MTKRSCQYGLKQNAMKADSKNPLGSAIKALREALGESQQDFAYRMKTAIRTIARYEGERPPKGKVLAQLEQIARENGQQEIARKFRDALAAELGTLEIEGVQLDLSPRTPTEKLWVSAVLAMLRNPEYAGEIPAAARVLRKAAAKSIKVLEDHKYALHVRKQASALLDRGATPEQIATELRIPLEDVRVLAGFREMKLALDQANAWAEERDAEDKSKG